MKRCVFEIVLALMVAVAMVKNMFWGSPDLPVFLTLSAVLCAALLWIAAAIEDIAKKSSG